MSIGSQFSTRRQFLQKPGGDRWIFGPLPVSSSILGPDFSSRRESEVQTVPITHRILPTVESSTRSPSPSNHCGRSVHSGSITLFMYKFLCLRRFSLSTIYWKVKHGFWLLGLENEIMRLRLNFLFRSALASLKNVVEHFPTNMYHALPKFQFQFQYYLQ